MARRLPRFLADDDPERIIKATRRERDRVLLLVALYCGLRCRELARLAVEDLDFGRKPLLLVRRGKGDKDRAVPIPKKILGPLRGWVAGRRSGTVFPSREGGGPLSNRSLQLLFKALCRRAGLNVDADPRRYTIHKMRHAYATRLLEAGASIHEVRDLLGHSSVSVTEVYLHTTADRLSAAVNRL